MLLWIACKDVRLLLVSTIFLTLFRLLIYVAIDATLTATLNNQAAILLILLLQLLSGGLLCLLTLEQIFHFEHGGGFLLCEGVLAGAAGRGAARVGVDDVHGLLVRLLLFVLMEVFREGGDLALVRPAG